MDEDKAEVRPNIDYIYSAVIADSEALEEAKMTLEIIKKTDPGVYDEMINDTLSLIRKALSSSILSVVDRMVKVEVEAEREACAKVCDDWQNNFEIDTRGWWASSAIAVDIRARGQNSAGFYQKKEWVGLTDEEHIQIAIDCGCLSADWVFYGAAIERKLKEKNA